MVAKEISGMRGKRKSGAGRRRGGWYYFRQMKKKQSRKTDRGGADNG